MLKFFKKQRLTFEENVRMNPFDVRYAAVKDARFPIKAARCIISELTETPFPQVETMYNPEIVYLSSIVAFLRDYENGRYCTFPHIVDMAQRTLEDTIKIVSTNTNYPGALMFKWSYERAPEQSRMAMEQTLNTIMKRISSPYFDYILSGDDFAKTENPDSIPILEYEISDTKLNHKIYDLTSKLYTIINIQTETKSVIKLKEDDINEETKTEIINAQLHIRKDINKIIKEYKIIFNEEQNNLKKKRTMIMEEINNTCYKTEMHYIQTGISDYNNTTPFVVKFDKPLYVKEFIKDILSKEYEGQIIIEDDHINYCGNQIETEDLDKFINRKIAKIKGRGGLNKATYNIELENE